MATYVILSRVPRRDLRSSGCVAEVRVDGDVPCTE